MTNGKTETPERIWIEDNDSAQYYDKPPRWSEGVEYVRADLLATVRAEEREAAFKEAIEIVTGLPIDNAVPNFTRASAFKAAAIASLKTAIGERQ